MANCDQTDSFDKSFSASDVVFVGQVIETKVEIVDTTHHGKFEYWDAKFKVLDSWKAADKQYIWVSVGTKKLDCGQIEEGREYIVFANQTPEGFRILPRSISVTDKSAKEDFQLLGNKTIELTPGEYFDHRELYTHIFVALAIVLIIFILIRYIGRRISN